MFTFHTRSITLFLLAATCLASCDSNPPESSVPPAGDSGLPLTDSQRQKLADNGNTMALALMQNLSTQLKAALQTGSPSTAVEVCKQVAIPITETTSKQFEGSVVRRTSLQTRNPLNAPDAMDRQVLLNWQDLKKEEKPLPEHSLQIATDGTHRFYKPLIVQELCTKCHGPSEMMGAELKALIDQLYPEDQARNYKVGDIRGAIAVETSL